MFSEDVVSTLLDFIDVRDRSIQERFEDFHARHPEVFAKLVELARIAKSRGKKVGIRLLWERMRWEFAVEHDAAEDFKLNDWYTSRYARLIAERYSDEFGDYFDLRNLRAT